MPSVQRFFSSSNNLARGAALVASSVRPSLAISRRHAQRQGNGRVRLQGTYTGHEAGLFELQTLAAGGVPRASAPQFVGVGNGQLQVLAVDAAAPQQALTLTLADLGVPTQHARLDVQGLGIRARAPGAAGNQIRLSVSPQLTHTPTAWALLADWEPGQETQTGEQWDFGAQPLTGGGELAEGSARISFGHDPQVYRPWRQYKDGAWRFGLSPALQRGLRKGTPVQQVSGGYVLTVSDGVDTETFGDVAAGQPPIVTLYELLRALEGSTLVEVVGVVSADRSPGGPAAMDVPLRTGAWLLGMEGQPALEAVSVPAAAPTQTVTVRCINDEALGAERWSVVGDVSGDLGVAVTGQPFSGPAINFTVPAVAPAQQRSGRWAFKFSPAARSEGQGEPSVCLRPVRLGASATPKTVTFRYTRCPPAECNCADMPTPRVPTEHLGLGSEVDIDDLDFLNRLQAIYAWRAGFVRSNTLVQTASTTPGTVGYVYYAFQAVASVREPDPPFNLNPPAYTGDNVKVDVYSAQEYTTEAAAQAALDTVMTQTVPAASTTGAPLMLGGVPVRLDGLENNGSATVLHVNLPHWHAGFASVRRVEVPDGASATTPPGFFAAQRDLEWAEGVLPILTACLARVYDKPQALADWDTLWAEVQADALHLSASPADDLGAGSSLRFLDRYRAVVDTILLKAGILPKSAPSTDAGSCWVDQQSSHWWVDVDGHYLPAFTNTAYVSARRDPDTGRPYSTQEFGFGLVVACPERLSVGDEITLRIDTVDDARPYRAGDETRLQTVAAGPAWLSGGVDGTDELTWRVHGSSSGALPDYVLPTTGGAPAPEWQGAGLRLQMALGGIPFALGDVFSLAVEAGQWRWRRGGGAWSGPQAIPASGTAALADGLSVLFEPGAAPSFADGDTYLFEAHQPFAASHLRTADGRAWGWDGDAATLTVDLGTAQPLQALALARYSLPPGAVLTLAHSLDGLAWSAPQPLDASRAVCVQPLAVQARYLRLSLSQAAGGQLGWLWLGVPLACDHHASRCTRQRRWAVERGEGLNPAGLYAGVGEGWSLAWSPADAAASRLLQSDLARLLPLLDWAQQHDEPLIFLPHHLHPQDAALVRFAANALEVQDLHEYQPDDASQRLLSAALELEPVFA